MYLRRNCSTSLTCLYRSVYIVYLVAFYRTRTLTFLEYYALANIGLSLPLLLSFTKRLLPKRYISNYYNGSICRSCIRQSILFFNMPLLYTYYIKAISNALFSACSACLIDLLLSSLFLTIVSYYSLYYIVLLILIYLIANSPSYLLSVYPSNITSS